MTCALCFKEKKLSNSHIVPDFIFKTLYGDKHEFYVVNAVEKPKRYHRTFAEKLLCQSCEAHFAKWESYAKGFFYGGMPLDWERWGSHFKISGVDYAPMKLFLMSLLWRFAATSIPCLQGLDLGPHKEHLRNLLLASDPVESWRYGCTIVAVANKRKHTHDLIVPPWSIRLSRERWHNVVVGGFLLSYYGSSHPSGNNAGAAMLQESGELILSPREISQIPYLVEMNRALVKPDLDSL